MVGVQENLWAVLVREAFKVKCVNCENKTATSSGYIINCSVFLSPFLPPLEFASELQWSVHPYPGTSSTSISSILSFHQNKNHNSSQILHTGPLNFNSFKTESTRKENQKYNKNSFRDFLGLFCRLSRQ